MRVPPGGHILIFTSPLLNLLFSMILSKVPVVNWLWFRTTYFPCFLQLVVHFLVESLCVKCVYRKSPILVVNFSSPEFVIFRDSIKGFLSRELALVLNYLFLCLVQVAVHFLVESWCVKCMYRKSPILVVNFLFS